VNCEERSGFLFAHACDQGAAWPCVRCGKQICHAHTRMTGEGQCCISCAREAHAADQQREGRQQDDDYTDTDDPYFYYTGSRSYYDADDRAAFDSSADEPEGGWEADPGGS